MPLFESIQNLKTSHETIRKRSYGTIEVYDEHFAGIRFKPWPKLISSIEAAWIGGWKHKRDRRNRCLLYYNRPIAHPNYLVLSYLQSSFGTSFATVRRAMLILDYVAMIKRSDALMCEITYERIPDRIMERWGWERHLQHSKKRHWIKRFYGDFDKVKAQTGELLALER